VLRGVESMFCEWDGYRSCLRLTPSDIVGVLADVRHSFGSGVALAAISASSRVNLSPIVPISAWTRACARGEVSLIATTPQLAEELAKVSGPRPSRPVAVLLGAGRTPAELRSRLIDRFAGQGYGSTETGGSMMGTEGIGSPMPGVRIVEPVKHVPGELVLEFDAPVLGYLHSPDLGNQGVWRTGDLVETVNGVTYLLRRIGPRLRINSQWLDLEPIAAKIAKTFPLLEYAWHVAPLTPESTKERLHVYCVSHTNIAQHLSELIRAEAGIVPVVHILASLPRTAQGKVDRESLRGLSKGAHDS
jgi:acyl-CoA synthetase (AMP-forming)/AMP-acid ligase II